MKSGPKREKGRNRTLAIAILTDYPQENEETLVEKKIIKMLQSMSISDREINLGVRKRD